MLFEFIYSMSCSSEMTVFSIWELITFKKTTIELQGESNLDIKFLVLCVNLFLCTSRL